MGRIKGVFRKIFQFRAAFGVFIIILIGGLSVIVFSILDIFYPGTIWDNFIAMTSILTTLTSGFIALLLPFIMKSIEEIGILDKRRAIRENCFNAVKELCEFCLEHQPGKIEEPYRSNLISQVEILDLHRKEAVEMGIALSGGWEKTETSIYIFIGGDLQILLRQPSYGMIVWVELKVKNKKVARFEDIVPILEDLKKRIEEI